MTDSYNSNNRELVQNLFDDANPGDHFQIGGKVWIYDGEKWLLEHVVVQGDETIKQGPPGPSAYDSYLSTTDDVPKLTESEWVESLKGKDGEDGERGADGTNGINGENGSNGEGGQGEQGPKGDTGQAQCENVNVPPTNSDRGVLYIDSTNQIIVTL